MEAKLIQLVYSQAPDVIKKHMQRNLQGSVASENWKHLNSFNPSYLLFWRTYPRQKCLTFFSRVYKISHHYYYNILFEQM